MTGSSPMRTLSRVSVVVVAVVAVAVLYFAKVVFLPLGFAILFAFLLAPLVSLLERIRLPRILAVITVILGFVIILGAIGWAVTLQLVDVAAELPTYRTNIADKMAAINRPGDTVFSRAGKEITRLDEQLGLADSSARTELSAGRGRPLGSSPERPLHVEEVSRSTGRLDQLGGFVEPLVTAFLTVVFTFFVLLQREDLRNRLIRLTGHDHLNLMTQAMNDASQRISRYFSLQLMVNCSYGLVILLALHLVGLPHALLFGTLAALFRFVPYIGAPVAALLPAVLSLAVFHGWTKTLAILGIFFCLEVVTANFAEPRLYGKHTGLSSLAILIAATFWTLIWGPVGLILSVPLTVCLVVLGRHVPDLEFLMVMLGDQPPIPPAACFYQRLLARDDREAGQVLDSYIKDKTLEDLYDSVVIPALNMSERDRHQKDLDEETVEFIHQTTTELIEDFGLKEVTAPDEEAVDRPQPAEAINVPAVKVLCVPVRDEADRIAATMLAQLLDGAGFRALVAPVTPSDQLLATVFAEKPDVVFLSGLPPFATARSRRIYRALRMRVPRLRIMIGLWNYLEDGPGTAQEISRGEEDHLSTTLAQAVAEVRAYAEQHGSSPAVQILPPAPALLAGEGAALVPAQ